MGGTLAHLNVGTGADLTIRELAGLVADAVGFDGHRVDPPMPDGTPRKLLNPPADRAGWNPSIRSRRPPRDRRRLPGRVQPPVPPPPEDS